LVIESNNLFKVYHIKNNPMNEKKLDIRLIVPVLLSFFVMSFCDLVGVGVDYVKSDFHLSNILSQLILSQPPITWTDLTKVFRTFSL
jgi:hypothetical protein